MSETTIINPAETQMLLVVALQRLAEAENKIATLQMRVSLLTKEVVAMGDDLTRVENRLGLLHQ